MKGELLRVASLCQRDILSVRENKDEVSFSVAKLEDIPHFDDIKTLTNGIYVNFYPDDSWFLKVAERYKNAVIPDFSPAKDRAETLERILSLCASYTGEDIKIPEVKNHSGLDGIHYAKSGVKSLEENKVCYDDSDPAFFLYRVKKLSDSAIGDKLSLDENGKKLIMSMAFLEKDMLRCVKWEDTIVLYKRAEKTARKYLDYYFDEKPQKDDKGFLSLAFSKFFEIIFYLLGSNALQDEKYMLL